MIIKIKRLYYRILRYFIFKKKKTRWVCGLCGWSQVYLDDPTYSNLRRKCKKKCLSQKLPGVRLKNYGYSGGVGIDYHYDISLLALFKKEKILTANITVDNMRR